MFKQRVDPSGVPDGFEDRVDPIKAPVNFGYPVGGHTLILR